MKIKWFSVFPFILALTACSSKNTDKTYLISKNMMDVYNNQEVVCSVEGYFLDDIDIPYVSLKDIAQYSINNGIENGFNVPNYNFKYKKGVLEAINNYKGNNVSIYFDANNDTIYSTAFLESLDSNYWGAPLDLLQEDPSLIVQSIDIPYEQKENLILDLGKYDIDLIINDDDVLIPFHILNSLYFWQKDMTYIYSAKKIFSSTDIQKKNSFSYNAYVSDYPEEKKNEPRTKSTAILNRSILCFEMDYFYGNKSLSAMKDFKTYAKSLGQYEKLASQIPLECYDALQIVITSIDDLHTSIGMPSISCGNINEMSEKDNAAISVYLSNMDYVGYRGESFNIVYNKLSNDRENYLGEEAETGFYYYGNTLTIRFDMFKRYSNSKVFTQNPNGGYTLNSIGYSQNTFNLFYDAFLDLKENHSEVENILIDISLNTGGDFTTLVEILGFLMKEVKLGFYCPILDDYLEVGYKVDTNLDGKYDDNDFQANGYNVYCLTSNVSFSCANLFPAILQESKMGTIIGNNTGGGNCLVMISSTACGDRYNKSSGYLSLAKKISDGVYMKSDQGVKPDQYILYDYFYYDNFVCDYIQYLN